MSAGNRTPRNPMLRRRAQLRQAAEVEQGRLGELSVVAEAESVVAGIHGSQVAAAAATARHRRSAALGRLTRAQDDGDPGAIAAARAWVEGATAEWEQLAATADAQITVLIRARLDAFAQMREQTQRAWEAQAAIVDTYQRPGGRG